MELQKAVSSCYTRITKLLIAGKLTVSTMESCTGGMIASLLTDTPGASEVITGGYVTYCNAAKIAAGVPAEVIAEHGVYSAQTACAMAQTVRSRLGTNIGIGITGSFGNPDPKNADSVIGSVDFAIAAEEKVLSFHVQLEPCETRLADKLTAALAVGNALETILEEKSSSKGEASC